VFEKLFGAGSSVADIDVQEAKRRQDAGALLVDVRELHEWQEGHARGALHVPLGDFDRRMGDIPKDREVLLICRSGNRSRTAARLLERAGYTLVVNVQGGTSAWIRQALPLG